MRLNIERASPGTCTSGTCSYYVCGTNGFTGCCTVDPCSLSTCPDTASISISNSASSTTPAAISPFAVKTLTVITESSSTSSSSSSSISTVIAAETTSSLPNAVVLTQTATPSAAQTSSPAPVSSTTHTVLIATVVPVMIVISLISILAWFCLRRCRQRKDAREARESYGIPSKQDYILDRPTSDGMEVEAIQKPDNDVFASFGGRYKSPKAGVAEMAPIPVHNPSRENGLNIESSNEEQPLPDPEKTGLTPPPVHEHPAYQGLLSQTQAPEIPAYHQSQAQHSPAPLSYSASTVSQRADQGNFSPLARITDVQDEYRPSYPARNYQGRQNSSPLSPHMEVVSPIISSPVPGHMELEGDTPTHFNVNSPIISPLNTPATCQSGHFAQSKNTEEVSLVKTIGLGLGVGVGVPRTSNQTPAAPHQMPSTFVPASKSHTTQSQSQTQHHHHNSHPPRTSTGLPHLLTSSPQKFLMSEEVVSRIQVAENICPTSLRPTPRSSLQSLNQGHNPIPNPNPNQPTISHLHHPIRRQNQNHRPHPHPHPHHPWTSAQKQNSEAAAAAAAAEPSTNRNSKPSINTNTHTNHHDDTLKEVVSPLLLSPERWSDITMVGNTPPVSANTSTTTPNGGISPLSAAAAAAATSFVPDAPVASVDQVQVQGYAQQQQQQQQLHPGLGSRMGGAGEGESPTSTYTEDGTNTWGSWAVR